MSITNFLILSRKVGRLVLVLLLLTLLGACLPPSGTDKEFSNTLSDPERDTHNTTRLSCFLNLKDDKGPAIRLEVAKIEVFVDNLWLPFISGPLEIESASIGSGQLFLGGVEMPSGSYKRLRFTFTKGELQGSDGKYEVISPEPFHIEIDFGAVLDLDPEDSSSLLITWDVEDSLQTDNSLLLDLTVALPHRQMPLDLVYVTCPDIDTIFVIRTDKNWVVDSFGLKGGPTFIGLGPDDSQLLYVLATRERTIKVVDLSSYRVINFFPVPFNDEPTFMAINPEGLEAYLLDERNGYLSRINLITGQFLARVQLSYRPKYVTYLKEQGLLAVSLSLSQQVLLLDHKSLRVLRTILTGSMPHGIAVSDNELLIAEYGENTVSFAGLNNSRTQGRMDVGFGPRRIVVIANQIYVSNYQDGSISVLETGQLGVTQVIYGLGRPLEMAFNQFYHRLYVSDVEKAALAVIDTNSNKLLEHIFLGARPFDLEVTQR